MNLVQIEGVPAGAPPIGGDAPWHHIVEGAPPVLLLVAGSRLYALPPGMLSQDLKSLRHSLEMGGREVPATQIERHVSALSLNIAQACNLACSYCYADEGRFGGQARRMPFEIAREAIRRHIHESDSRSVSIGFIGGEPLMNRAVLHACVRYAAREARRRGVRLSFGITTNGTLLEPADLDLLRSNPFAVTVSMDGARDLHNALRSTRQGQPSFDRAVERVSPLLLRPGSARVAARVTLTRRSLDVSACVDALSEAGFTEIGVSPLRTGPDPSLCVSDGDWPALLDQMKAAANRDWVRARGAEQGLRFSNFAVALKQLYRGASNILPCRAAAGYVSLAADGRYYTCHRTIGNPSCEVGHVSSGPSADARREFLQHRHVDEQEPCRSCWARYLCGGGCHAEVLQAGRRGCDYIRGWLEYCISMYPKILSERPDLLGIASQGGRSL